MTFGLVSFLSDYGRTDTFVGVCHGIVLGRAPHVRIVDLTHDVPPHDVRVGALLLARSVPFLPVAVHLAVVDPGVGTPRRGVAVAAARGDLLVGPDNGLLWPAVARLGGASGVWELTEPQFWLEPLSGTFHGRDIFAPVAAHLAAEVAPERVGQAIDPGSLQLLDLPGATVRRGELSAWRNLSKMILWSSALMPGPLSATSTRNQPPDSDSCTRTRPLSASQT